MSEWAPYTYLLKCIPTNRLYYGVKYGKDANPNTFWIEYTTSSKRIKSDIRKYGKDAFVFEIRKVFDSADSAINWESKVISRMNMDKRPEFYNMSRPTKDFTIALYGQDNPMANTTIAEKNIKSISNTMKTRWNLDADITKFSDLNSVKIECPHCNKIGGFINMRRYHFDKCHKINNK